MVASDLVVCISVHDSRRGPCFSIHASNIINQCILLLSGTTLIFLISHFNSGSVVKIA